MTTPKNEEEQDPRDDLIKIIVPTNESKMNDKIKEINEAKDKIQNIEALIDAQ